MIDSAIGGRVRQRRRELGLTQAQLALALGVTFQQVQKYESGANRISAATLFWTARALQTTPAYFFQDIHAQSQADQQLA